MKFVRSNFAKKLIIILIALMIFNIAVPKSVSAVDLGGILLKPLCSVLLIPIAILDVTVGAFLGGLNLAMTGFSGIVDDILDKKDGWDIDGKTWKASDILVGPDTIFGGRLRILDANIFKASDGGIKGMNLPYLLKKSIAQVYVVIRNLCAILMLAGLIFTGIRILISANIPSKSAQWRAYIQDWLIGMILLIFSHIMMYGIFWISDKVVESLQASFYNGSSMNWSIMKECLGSWDSAQQVMCLIMLYYLVYLTVVFAIAYFKRLIWVCVLIIIAPIVSIMYAFGPQTKQIYSKWLREYITTVFVQPFHAVVYYVLVTIPLNMTGTSHFTTFEMFALIYGLVAMSFIRPAEKYIRELFGMHQGIANMASFDSGKQTMDAIADKIKEVAMIIGMVATGGAAAAASGAATAGATAEIGATSESIGGLTLGEGNVPSYSNGYDIKTGSPNGLDQGALDLYSAPSNEFDQGTLDAYSFSYNPETNLEPEVNAKAEANADADANAKADAKTQTDLNTEPSSSGKKEEIEAGNVTINANNVDLQGEKTEENAKENAKEKIETNIEGEVKRNIDDETLKKLETKESMEDQIEVIDGKGTKRNIFSTINPLKDVKDFFKVATGSKGAIDTIGDHLSALNDTKLADKLLRDNPIARTKPARFIREKASNAGEKLQRFEDLGGMQALHRGFNEIRDTFYVTPAPQDWKKSDERMNIIQKEKQEQIKFNVVNNKGAQNYIIKQEGYMEKLRAQYPDEAKYPDARLEEMAVERAKTKLKAFADTYAPLGVTDGKAMYELDKDRKKYGLTATEAVQQRASFEKFNNNQNNVVKVNIENKPNVTTVSQVIPNAKEYYYNGYTNTKDMTNVAKAIEEKLKVSPDFAMTIDKVLKKKGGQINYKGNDAEVKKAFDQLNDSYKK